MSSSEDSSVEETISPTQNTCGLGNILAATLPSYTPRVKTKTKEAHKSDKVKSEDQPLKKKRRVRKQIGFGRKQKNKKRKYKKRIAKKSIQTGSGSRTTKKRRLRRLYAFRRAPF